jgi:hypothetical protein
VVEVVEAMTTDSFTIDLRCSVAECADIIEVFNLHYGYFGLDEPWFPAFVTIWTHLSNVRLRMTERDRNGITSPDEIGQVNIVLTGDGCRLTFVSGSPDMRRKYQLLSAVIVDHLYDHRFVIEPTLPTPSLEVNEERNTGMIAGPQMKANINSEIPDIPDDNSSEWNTSADWWEAVFDWDERYGRLAGITDDHQLAVRIVRSHSRVRAMRSILRRLRRKTEET